MKHIVSHFLLPVQSWSSLWDVVLRLRYELENLQLCKGDSVCPYL